MGTLTSVIERYGIERDSSLMDRLLRDQNNLENIEQEGTESQDMLTDAIDAMRESLERVDWRGLTNSLKQSLSQKGSMLKESISENFDGRNVLARLTGDNPLILKAFDIYKTYKSKQEQAFTRESDSTFTRETEDTMFDTTTQESDTRTERRQDIFQREQAAEDALVRAEQNEAVTDRLDTIIGLMKDQLDLTKDLIKINEDSLLEKLSDLSNITGGGGFGGGRRGPRRGPRRPGRLRRMGGRIGQAGKAIGRAGGGLIRGAGGMIARGAMMAAPYALPTAAVIGAGAAGAAVGTAIYDSAKDNESFKSGTDTFFNFFTGKESKSMEEMDKEAIKKSYEAKVATGQTIDPKLAQYYEKNGVTVDKSLIVDDTKRTNNTKTESTLIVKDVGGDVKSTANGELPVDKMNEVLNFKKENDVQSSKVSPIQIQTQKAEVITGVTPTARRLEAVMNREAAVGTAIESGTAEVTERQQDIQAAKSAAVVSKAAASMPASDRKATQRSVYTPGGGSQDTSVANSARNNDSSIQRITDRYMLFGMT